ncbi:hypothetical protein L596_000403 [Steinernema carpocapsae]|uniref:Insulin-like domain-containing protein n=1 Tax=Steinernema carpocapsae TaxID=34508 RepID=A0A4V6I740_STECR|nr:hypothetical protein L596_000403 [Steinernema carpocapsae]
MILPRVLVFAAILVFASIATSKVVLTLRPICHDKDLQRMEAALCEKMHHKDGNGMYCIPEPPYLGHANIRAMSRFECCTQPCNQTHLAERLCVPCHTLRA